MTSARPASSELKPLLIFPAGMPRAIEYFDQCRRGGQRVIGSSSLAFDPARELYPEWAFLPFVTDPTFADALHNTIDRLEIGGIYCPNPQAWIQIKALLEEVGRGDLLINSWPVDEEMSQFRAARAQARTLLSQPLALASVTTPKPTISSVEIASLLLHAHAIPGMCDQEKITALHEIARRAPSGDIVEIGSAWGKSAFVLSRLSRVYGIGSLLCVDPWMSEHLVQDDGTSLVDVTAAQVDTDEVHLVYLMNLLPYSQGTVNFLRMPSVEGAARYASSKSVETAAFGRTDYAGQIAILHIDGNHRYDAARADLSSWGRFVAPGGWIVIDDYVWPYGDGPQRVGDEFLAARSDVIANAFVMGSCLMIQISPDCERNSTSSH